MDLEKKMAVPAGETCALFAPAPADARNHDAERDKSGDIKISVILPVYNPGEGLDRCIRCLQNQTLREIEMIFVDDCGSREDVDKISAAMEHDQRIILLKNPENLGPGLSRNRGIEVAKGEYLSFVDPDDYIEDDFLELLYYKGVDTRADIVKGTMAYVRENGSVLPRKTNFLSKEIRKGLQKGRPLYGLFTYQHQSALYRRELVMSSGVRYGTTRFGEDTTFLLRICFAAKTIAFEDGAVYYYVERDSSAVHQVTPQRLEQNLQAVREKLEFLLPRIEPDPFLYRYINSRIYYYLRIFAAAEQKETDAEKFKHLRFLFRNYLSSLPFSKALGEQNFIIGAFLKYDANLITEPYSGGWKKAARIEYEAVARRWVEFLRAHPEYAKRSKARLRRIFDDAIKYDARESPEEKKKAMREIRRLARRLPDRSILTEDYAAMTLFVNFGVNTFPLRDTPTGAKIKKLLARARKMRKKNHNISAPGREHVKAASMYRTRNRDRESCRREDGVKVSVIIPVYNPGEGLDRCIRSVQNQTLREIEMIFVDDCGSREAVDKIRAAMRDDPRIILLENPENLGPGPSRNRGIETARGEYLSFVDPDDYIAEDFLELLYAKALNTWAEIVRGEELHLNLDGTVQRRGRLTQHIKKGLKQDRPLYALFTYEHTTALYRRELVMSSGARYGTSRHAQDTTFLLQICFYAESIAFENRAVYYYVERTESAVHKMTSQRVEQDILSVHEQLEFLTSHCEVDSEMCGYAVNGIHYCLKLMATVEKNSGMADKIERIQSEFRDYILSLPVSEGAAEKSFVIAAFLDYNVNLADTPYRGSWRKAPYAEYKDVVVRWVDFLCAHPEYTRKNKKRLKIIVENAINYSAWNDEAERKKELRELRRLARRLPDRSVLTEGDTAMTLFMALGVNTFDLWNTPSGKAIKKFWPKLKRHKEH